MFSFVKAFIAGFLAVLIFHQGALWLLDLAGVVSAPVWPLTGVPPFGIPAVISAALFGGLWGMLLWLLIRHAQAAGYYVGALLLGAVLPSLVALTLVTWLKNGMDLAAVLEGLRLPRIAIALIVNGSWGLGLALLMRVMHPPR